MTTTSIVALVAVALVGLVSSAIGAMGVRVARGTSDFLVASRTVGTTANASAISGEYLSAASFLGIAGLLLREGADALWYPVAFVAGFLGLALFVAAPLRRSGAYTVPDFAEARLASQPLRRLCTLFVVLIGWLYLLPQLQGAAMVVSTLTAAPPWVGAAGAGLVVVGTVAAGGMRSVTFVQAFQYWLKLTALVVPALVISSLFLSDGTPAFDGTVPERFAAQTRVEIRTDVLLQTAVPTAVLATGEVDGAPVDGELVWAPGTHRVLAGSSLTFAAGDPVPAVAGMPVSDPGWLEPSGDGLRLLEIYSILLAGFLGTMGLPHVLVRFYTNPDGGAARRTALGVLAMIGGFSVLVVVMGALSRIYTPRLLLTGETDAAVLLLPSAALGEGWSAWLLGGLLAAGAAAAFLSTSSGLVVSLAGVLFSDVLGGRWRTPHAATVLAGAVPLVLALALPRLDFALAVPVVFAVAASTFCPLLVLGIWWRGLTATGAVAGVLVGGTLSMAAVTAGYLAQPGPGLLAVLLYRPAAVSVPAAFLTMVLVSRATRAQVPVDVDEVLLRLHAPERLGLALDRLDDDVR